MVYAFANFRLDLGTRELRLADEPVALGPKPFDLLALLISRRGSVVTKDELYETLWPGTHISESALTSTVKLARRALRQGGVRESEGAGIKAVHGRGFRFVGTVTSGGPDSRPARADAPSAASASRAADSGFVGRASELAALQSALETVRAGETQTALVVGEAGIGKTALIDIFVENARAQGARIARGQSVEHCGRDEPYLPVLEAWGRLVSGPEADELLPHLRKLAPSWLAHLPSTPEDETEELRRGTKDRTAGRMLREMAEVLERASRSSPLILILEDVHWSDQATIELLTYLTQRRSRSRVLLIATYRPSEMTEAGTALLDLAHDVGGKGRGVELRLSKLEPSEVDAYLRHRLSGGELDPGVAEQFHQRTEGHPLFLSSVVDLALQEGRIARAGDRWRLEADLQSLVPADLRKIIDRQIEAMSDKDRLLLEAASAAGAEFSVAALTTALDESRDELETRCEALAWREQFLEDAGIDEWPDGTIAGRYRFIHALYADVLYARVASARRVRVHRAIGERIEHAFEARKEKVCGELAVHFELGRDVRRAISYRREAARVAGARHANREAIAHLNVARGLLPDVPAQERPRVELDLLLEFVGRQRSARTLDGSTIEVAVDRALVLAREFGTNEQVVQLLVVATGFFLTKGRAQEAIASANEALEYGQRAESDVALVQAHVALGKSKQHQGFIEAADEHYRIVLDLYDPSTHAEHMTEYGEADPAVSCCMWRAGLLFSLGLPERAKASHDEGIARAQALQHPLSLCWAYLMSSLYFLAQTDARQGHEALTLSETISSEEEFELEVVMSGVARGWHHLLSGQAGAAIPILEETLAQYERLGATTFMPICQAVLGSSYALAGRVEDAERCFQDGLALALQTEQPLLHGIVLRSYTGILGMLGRMTPAEIEEKLLPSLTDLRRLGEIAGELATAVQIANTRVVRRDFAGARMVLEPSFLEFPANCDLPIVLEAKEILRQLDAHPED